MGVFNSVLVANRGEIALRVMHSVRVAGLRCIAVHTVADALAPHVTFADQAVCIGQGPAGDSYLSIDKIIDAARLTGAEAVHPGYGFLSERADFAKACGDAGLVFIGPPANAIELMGNKAAAKSHMISAGVSCVPGYEGPDQSDTAFTSQADRIGYPVMIKAAAGGGGRGMRLVDRSKALPDALFQARAEAKSAFGSDQLILEKALIRPRHIEVQVFADRHGNFLHLGERDCSIQRRHQKVVEEAPCPVVSADLRAALGRTAVEAARAIAYEGAGTVEFLLDDQGVFYFLEMNTRLQVEHPVTELVTGLDLVAMQLAVAAGEPLEFTQEDLALDGHAIEVRLYAEDPANNFLPTNGKIGLWQPATGPGIRVDAGIVIGETVSQYYDPMLAKVIAHGSNREEARRKLITALQETALLGVTTNRDFLIDVLCHQTFANAKATTAFIAEEYGDPAGGGRAPEFGDIVTAASLIYRALQARAAGTALGVPDDLLGWGSPGALTSRVQVSTGDRVHSLWLRESRDGSLEVSDGQNRATATGEQGDLRIDGNRANVRAWLYDDHCIQFATSTRTFNFVHVRAETEVQNAVASGIVAAPMHGNLVEVFVDEGTKVVPGARLAVLEAMKMRHELLASVHGTVTSIIGIANTQVKAGDILIEITPSDNMT